MIDSNTRAERLKLWTTALRSGEYKQATGYLRAAGGYCCLGVACDVYNKATGGGRWGADLGHQTFYAENSSDYVALPRDVAEWFGVEQGGNFVTSVFIDNNTILSLIGLNDDVNYTFEQIAEYIENNTENIELFEEVKLEVEADE